MLFNSLPFVFLFLPLTLAGYYALIRLGLRRWIFLFLVFASLIFYSVWNPPYILLLIASMGGNYLFGLWIERQRASGRGLGLALTFGVLANLAVLGWYKYAGFFLENLNAALGASWTLEKIILPLAISFYTFQQIAYLVDIARGEVKSGGVSRYATFVIFFPQLIAGPIVHYRDMMPQFFGPNLGRFWRADLVIGFSLFAVGLFKKTVIADSAASFSSPVFDLAAQGQPITLLEGWKAAICYTFQLYFDFSGYSDMAVGLARMFGLLLPPNFHSPLRAASIIDYWRRWHMTLQQFIVSYMYQPLVLPLTRLAAARGFGRWPTFLMTVAAPTVALFVVIGLWHGAAWTFVVFGLMHGVYLATNEFWRAIKRKRRRKDPPGAGSMIVYHAITLFAVVMANVVFRAESLSDAFEVWQAMFALDQLSTLPQVLPTRLGEALSEPLIFVLVVAALTAFAPNSQQLFKRYRPVLGWETLRRTGVPIFDLTWRPTLFWAIWTGTVLFFGVIFILRAQSEFIYFNF